ncbi:MAG TPA: undecaprenyl-diphosphatase UppP [Dehalococcoidia bacterium]|jgi:undecaprenyl-diphosphatase|nr:undecaprenyl-diphosphatase UppP [Dehalococcoidia bacterium]
MEDLLHAIVLGIVQGLSEFLPISSSGHLIVVRDLFHWQFTDNLTFDVALHVGTTVAVLVYFWREWLSMARALLRWVSGDREPRIGELYNAHVLGLIILGSIPIGILGILFEKKFEDWIRDPVVVGTMLFLFAFVLLAVDRLDRATKTLSDATWKDALFIGCAQSMALVPGVSRSGATIAAGLFRNFNRQDAARYSFLLSTPAIGGAALLKFSEALRDGTLTDNLDQMVVGATAAAIVGFISIAFLMRLVQTRTFLPFVSYRLLAGAFFVLYFTL